MEDEVSIKKAFQQLIKREENPEYDFRAVGETGGAADFDANVMSRVTGGEVPSAKIARLQSELELLTQELKELETAEVPKRLRKDP